MTELRLTLLLGPRETVEAAELAMPDLPHVLAAAFPLDAWDADEVERVLMLAGGAFRQAITERKHEEPPPPPKRMPAEVTEAERRHAAVDGLTVIGPALPAEVELAMDVAVPAVPLVALEAASPLHGLRFDVARALAPEAWAEADASLRKADMVLAVVERRRVA